MGMERGVRPVSYPLMIKTLSQSCRQPDLRCSFPCFRARDGMLLVLVVVENTKRANLRDFGTNTSGLYIVCNLKQ
jgi:hypothetical protein